MLWLQSEADLCGDLMRLLKARPQQRLSGVSPGVNLKAAPGSLAPQSPSAWKPGFLLPGFQGVEFDLGRGQVVCFPLDLVAMPSLN